MLVPNLDVGDDIRDILIIDADRFGIDRNSLVSQCYRERRHFARTLSERGRRRAFGGAGTEPDLACASDGTTDSITEGLIHTNSGTELKVVDLSIALWSKIHAKEATMCTPLESWLHNIDYREVHCSTIIPLACCNQQIVRM